MQRSQRSQAFSQDHGLGLVARQPSDQMILTTILLKMMMVNGHYDNKACESVDYEYVGDDISDDDDDSFSQMRNI